MSNEDSYDELSMNQKNLHKRKKERYDRERTSQLENSFKSTSDFLINVVERVALTS